MKKTIIFDMDGVIINSEHIFKQVEKDMFQDYNIPYSSSEVDRFIGMTVFDFWQHILKEYKPRNLEYEQAIEEHTQRYLKYVDQDDSFSIVPGVKKWMKMFKDIGFDLYIASSSRSIIVEYMIKRFSLDNYISGYVGGDSVENGKPSPEIFLKACKMSKNQPKNCLVIEDSANGVLGAKRAGMICVAYENETSGAQDHSKADLVIKKMNEENFSKVIDLIGG